MNELLSNPAVQAGAAPFLAALVVTLALRPLKLGGLAMPDLGFGWHTAPRPPSSDELVAAQAGHYLHTIDAFGPQRCMFESNFPVDRHSVGYTVLWNAFQKLAASYSEHEQAALFAGTAQRAYRI